MDVWNEDVPSCKFCDLRLDQSTAKKGKFKSHLLYECGGVHNSQPIKRANLPYGGKVYPCPCTFVHVCPFVHGFF